MTYMEATACHFCSKVQTFAAGWVNAAHWTTEGWVRVDACGTCRPKLVLSAPRKPKAAKKAPQALYGDFAQLAAFHGIATDGTGKVAK